MRKKIVLGLSVAIISTIYVTGYLITSNKTGPRTFINGSNVSIMSVDEVVKSVEEQSSIKELKIISDDKEFISIDSKDIEYRLSSYEGINNIIEDRRNIFWPLDLMSDKNHELEYRFEYDDNKLAKIVADSEILDSKPANASLVYSESEESFIIEPHSYGVELTSEELLALINDAISNGEDTLDISESLVHPEILDDNSGLVRAREDSNDYSDVVINVDLGNEEIVINKDIIKEWIIFDKEKASFKRENIRDFVIDNISKHDTFGKEREFRTTSGETKIISEGAYGWLTHRSDTVDKIIESIMSKKDTTIEPAYSYTAVTRGSSDIGSSYIEIDIDNQMVYLYSKGELKVESKTVTGNPNKGFSTPRNRIDPITYKTTNAVLRGPGYASPVEYWMPFNRDVGLHDASWQSSFGGELYKSRGSRGCINLPLSSAEQIYKLAFEGMPVIVH